MPIVVLASGNGSNLQKIIDRFERSRLVEVRGVASNHANARALQRAKEHDLPTAVFERGAFRDRLVRDEYMGRWIEDRGAELVVSAGYLEILSPAFVEKFQGRIINIHPSLLPDYPGLNAIKRAYADGKRRNGITIHFVDDGVDTGPQIKTKTVVRYPWDSLESFESRVHAREHRYLPKVIRDIALGKIKLGLRPRDGLVTENQIERLSRYAHTVAAAPGVVVAFFSSSPSSGTARAGHH